MAVPRNRTSNRKKNARRSHHAKTAKPMSECSNCKKLRMPHRLCPHCGFYNGLSRVNTEA